MTHHTIRGKIRRKVVRVSGLVIVFLMAGKAVRVYIREIIHIVAATAILNIVSLGQWEKVVHNILGVPTKTKGVVAEYTICGKSRQSMIWILRGQVVIIMAFQAIIPYGEKFQAGGVIMAFHTA
jgi:translation initiation factor IF-1